MSACIGSRFQPSPLPVNVMVNGSVNRGKISGWGNARFPSAACSRLLARPPVLP